MTAQGGGTPDRSALRSRLFGFIEAGAEENDLPSFATALDEYVAALPDVTAAIVEALRERAGELSELAEEQMRPSLEERAQEWHEAAELARRIGRKTRRPATEGER